MMLHLEEELREAIEKFYDLKLKHSEYYGLQELWDIIEDCICEVQEITNDYEKKVDDTIQEYEEKREEERIKLKEKGIKLL